MSQEFHDLSEQLLNSDAQYWGNLGYWQSHNEYSSACAALANVLATAVQLDARSNVFDAGFGCGDQLLLWLKTYHINSIQGINYSVSQTDLAKKRLNEAGFSAAASQVFYGSVSAMCTPKNCSNNSINTVLALDCAYHFPSRRQFFADSYRMLESGSCIGRIGLTDIVLADNRLSTWQYFVLHTMLFLSRIPKNNIVILSHYKNELAQAGFDNIKIKDISEQVFVPFSDWLNAFKQGEGQLKSASKLTWLKYDITAKFLSWAYRHNILRYAVITADKRS